MAIHFSHKSMVKESLPELIMASEMCINFQKDSNIWGSPGCLGYPSLILLLAVADAIGSYVIGGRNTRNHFNILNHSEYYNLSLSKGEIQKIYKSFRCLGTHNAVLGADVILKIGNISELPFTTSSKIELRLKPFLKLSKEVVEKFIKNSDVIVPDQVKKE